MLYYLLKCLVKFSSKQVLLISIIIYSIDSSILILVVSGIYRYIYGSFIANQIIKFNKFRESYIICCKNFFLLTYLFAVLLYYYIIYLLYYYVVEHIIIFMNLLLYYLFISLLFCTFAYGNKL